MAEEEYQCTEKILNEREKEKEVHFGARLRSQKCVTHHSSCSFSSDNIHVKMTLVLQYINQYFNTPISTVTHQPVV